MKSIDLIRELRQCDSTPDIVIAYQLVDHLQGLERSYKSLTEEMDRVESTITSIIKNHKENKPSLFSIKE